MSLLRGRAVSRRVLLQMAAVGVSTSLVKVAGAAKVVLTARAFGMSDGLDAYLIAFLLPSFVSDTLAGSLSSALVPTLVEVRELNGPDAARRLYQSVLGAATGVLALAGLALAALAPWVLKLLASSFDEPKLALARTLFLIMAPIVPMGALNMVWRSLLNIEGRFALPALIPATTPIITIALLLRFGHSWNVYTLAAGTLAGVALEAALLGLSMRRAGFPILPRWHGRDAALDQVVRQYGPVVAGTLLLGGAPLIDQGIAGMLGSGGVAALNYGTRLAAVLIAIGPGAVATAILPHFSKRTVSQDWQHLRRSLRGYAVIVIAAALPVTAVLIAYSAPLTRVLFERGQFTGAATEAVAAVQRYSLLAIPPAMVMALVLRLISSLKANHLLWRAAVLSITLNLALDIVLSRWMGVAGIALTGAVVQLAGAAYLWRRLGAEFSLRLDTANTHIAGTPDFPPPAETIETRPRAGR